MIIVDLDQSDADVGPNMKPELEIASNGKGKSVMVDETAESDGYTPPRLVVSRSRLRISISFHIHTYKHTNFIYFLVVISRVYDDDTFNTIDTEYVTIKKMELYVFFVYDSACCFDFFVSDAMQGNNVVSVKPIYPLKR